MEAILITRMWRAIFSSLLLFFKPGKGVSWKVPSRTECRSAVFSWPHDTMDQVMYQYKFNRKNKQGRDPHNLDDRVTTCESYI